MSKETDAFVQKIKVCEEMIIKKEAYHTLFKEIIEYLELHYSSQSSEYRKLMKRIQKEAPHVFDLIRI